MNEDVRIKTEQLNFKNKSMTYKAKDSSLTFPTKLVTTSILLTIISITSLAIFFKKSYDSLEEFTQRDMRIIDTQNQITYYDEVLTMSARLATNEHQDFKLYYDRYHEHEGKLGALIKGIVDVANKLDYRPEVILEIDLAYQELISMELRSFEFARNRNFRAARDLLSSDEYLHYKKLYSSSATKLMESTKESVYNLLERNKRHIFYIEIIVLISIFVLCATWIYVLINIRSWVQETGLSFEELNINRKRLEISMASLEESNQELERFNFFIAHDLKEPLRTIHSFSQLIEEEGANANIKDYLNRIQKSCLFIRQLIEDLLSYGLAKEAGVAISEIDLGVLMEEVCSESLDKLIKTKKASILYDNLPKIRTSPIKLKQVLSNIIANGLIYNLSTKPVLEIRANENEDNWTISIEDNGMGIKKEYQDKIFKLFVRLNNKSFNHGSGIGLAICKKITTQIHGELWIEKSNENGSIFKISIPKDITSDKEAENGAS